MIDGKGAGEALIHQIGIEHRHLLGQHHAFVNDRTAGQRGDVKLPHTRCGRRFFNPAADHVEIALKRFFIYPFGVADQNLFNFGPRCVGFFTQTTDLNGHVSPSIDIIAHPQNFAFNDASAGFLRAKICAG